MLLLLLNALALLNRGGISVCEGRPIAALGTHSPTLFALPNISLRRARHIFANPVTDEGNKFDVDEEQALHWFDEAIIYARGGSGGHGASTFKFGQGRSHAYPNGGSGGDGGSVYLVCDTGINTLMGFKGHASFKAHNGEDGQCDYVNGRKGADVRVNVPMGTTVSDNVTNEVIGELSYQGQELLVAGGGLGGKGNGATKKVRGQAQKALPPEPSEKRVCRLEVRVVADVGLVGVPNAGKSTLLSAVTNARPKIASYPFTTIVPNIGVCEIGNVSDGGQTMVVVDVPGLLEGAHRGVGLGRAFLRHIERCRIIVHVVDGSSPDPLGDFRAINSELNMFSPTLAKKPQVVVLNKIDLPQVQSIQHDLLTQLQSVASHSRIIPISAAAGINVTELMTRTHKFLTKVRQDELFGTQNPHQPESMNQIHISIQVQDNGYRALVSGETVAQVLGGVDWKYYDALARFLAASEAVGMFQSLACAEPPIVSGARVLLDGGTLKKEFVWSAETQELMPIA